MIIDGLLAALIAPVASMPGISTVIGHASSHRPFPFQSWNGSPRSYAPFLLTSLNGSRCVIVLSVPENSIWYAYTRHVASPTVVGGLGVRRTISVSGCATARQPGCATGSFAASE